MGGYLVNGCGASDSYYPIRNVGQFYCSKCRNTRTFAVMQLKRKVRVLYIPTVSLSVKYAIVCTSCRNGYYIEESAKDQILAGYAVPQVTEEGLLIRTLRTVNPETPKLDDNVSSEPASSGEEVPRKYDAEEMEVETKVETIEEAPAPAKILFCVNCGRRLDEVTGLCPVCSASAETDTEEQGEEETVDTGEPWKMGETVDSGDPENTKDTEDTGNGSVIAQEVSQKRKMCPSCKLTFPTAKEKCTLCGRELVYQE